MRRNNKAKDQKRRPGWIGTRVTVCGYRLHTEHDLICLLPPHTTETIHHASMAMDQQTNQPVLVIEHPDHIEMIQSNG